MRVSSLRVSDLSHALTRATTDRIMKEKAMIVGEKIRAVRHPSLHSVLDQFADLLVLVGRRMVSATL